ncbi:EAL domain-containing protein [Paraburkholderia sp. GAS32]|jgi:predicted signal transduction protein with EAL and GGDEF domain|uniref:EAL domain-containing protein n=1 Tax=Paraburkholderia sp. GAS32 TaxID=3035129 RepID=UPI003D1A69E2
MGRLIPTDHIGLLRQVTFAAYYLLIAALFVELFRHKLKAIGLGRNLAVPRDATDHVEARAGESVRLLGAAASAHAGRLGDHYGEADRPAEDSSTIAAIDRWVLSTTLAWLSENRASLSTTCFVCVNQSGGSLNDEHFLDDLFALFSRHEDVIHYLCIDINESAALHDLEHTERFIARVHDMGEKIAIDDFGAGQSSLRYLKKLSADALKIDGEFVRTMSNHPTDIAIVGAIITLARNLGMRSIAEWVEEPLCSFLNG